MEKSSLAPAAEEGVPLNTRPGSGEQQQQRSAQPVIIRDVESCCGDRHHRRLAVCSIICGCTCIGIVALISSVKAETTDDPEVAARFSHRAKKCGILSIVAWYGFVCAVLILMALVSYLLSLRE